MSSIKKLLSISRERYRYGDPKVAEFVSKTKVRAGIDIMNKKELKNGPKKILWTRKNKRADWNRYYEQERTKERTEIDIMNKKE